MKAKALQVPSTPAEFDKLASKPDAPVQAGYSIVGKPDVTDNADNAPTHLRSPYNCILERFARAERGSTFQELLLDTRMSSEDLAYWLQSNLIQPRHNGRTIVYEPSQAALVLEATERFA